MVTFVLVLHDVSLCGAGCLLIAVTFLCSRDWHTITVAVRRLVLLPISTFQVQAQLPFETEPEHSGARDVVYRGRLSRSRWSSFRQMPLFTTRALVEVAGGWDSHLPGTSP